MNRRAVIERVNERTNEPRHGSSWINYFCDRQAGAWGQQTGGRRCEKLGTRRATRWNSIRPVLGARKALPLRPAIDCQEIDFDSVWNLMISQCAEIILRFLDFRWLQEPPKRNT